MALPRSGDYPQQNPDNVDQDYKPYAVVVKRPGNEDRDVEANTAGRSSTTPLLHPEGVRGDIRVSSSTSNGTGDCAPYGTALNDGCSQGTMTTPDLRKPGKEDGPARVASGSR